MVVFLGCAFVNTSWVLLYTTGTQIKRHRSTTWSCAFFPPSQLLSYKKGKKETKLNSNGEKHLLKHVNIGQNQVRLACHCLS